MQIANQNHPITPGGSSHYAHLSHPEDLPCILRDPVIQSHFDGIFQRYDLIKKVQMTGGRLTDDLINIFQDPVFQSHLDGIFRKYDLIKKVQFTPDDQNPAFHWPNEEMNRRFDREGIHGKMSPPRLPPDQTNNALYCLVFQNKVKGRIYANNPVETENGGPIEVAICDIFTNSVITTDPLSSAKVILTVLDAEFSKNKRKTWSWSEFNQSVLIRGRDGKGPILTGPGLTIRLKNGIGTFENIIFNDNSSWRKDRFIRLGVMVECEGEKGYLNGKRVQEGVSKPFRVFDCRSRASQKPDILKLTHGVKSIKKIGKDRASRLQDRNINTVEDFLQWYYNDKPALREILYIKQDSTKDWRSMVDHAKQCADEFHAKYNASNNSSHPQHASVHLTERNIPLSTNGGRLVVSLGSLEPNPSENERIEAGVPAINRQCFPMCRNGHTRNNFLFEPFSSENGDSKQPTNGGLVLGLGTSEQNLSKNNRIEVGMPMSDNGYTRNKVQFESFSSENGDSMQPTNSGFVVGLGSSESSPSENNRIEAGMPMSDNGHTRNNVRFEPFSSEIGDSMQPTNGGLVLGLGLPEPNPSENNRIEAGMPMADNGLPRNNVRFELFSSENGDSMHPTNGGLVVGLGSSELNPFENNRIEAGVPAINRQRFPMCHNGQTRNNFLFEPFSSENGDSMQTTYGGLVLGLRSSEPNLYENNRIEAGVSTINRQCFPMCHNGYMRNNFVIEPFSNENVDSMQPTDGGLVVGLGSSEPNPSGNNRIEAGMPMLDNGHTRNNIRFELFSSENGNSMQPTNDGIVVGLGSSEPNPSENNRTEGVVGLPQYDPSFGASFSFSDNGNIFNGNYRDSGYFDGYLWSYGLEDPSAKE